MSHILLIGTLTKINHKTLDEQMDDQLISDNQTHSTSSIDDFVWFCIFIPSENSKPNRISVTTCSEFAIAFKSHVQFHGLLPKNIRSIEFNADKSNCSYALFRRSTTLIGTAESRNSSVCKRFEDKSNLCSEIKSANVNDWMESKRLCDIFIVSIDPINANWLSSRCVILLNDISKFFKWSRSFSSIVVKWLWLKFKIYLKEKAMSIIDCVLAKSTIGRRKHSAYGWAVGNECFILYLIMLSNYVFVNKMSKIFVQKKQSSIYGKIYAYI